MSFTLRTAENGVSYMVSDHLISRHAFATRLGGVSPAGPTESLNLAFGRGDTREVVLTNLDRFGEAVGFDSHSMVSVHAIHSNTVHTVDATHRGLGYHLPTDMVGDGYVTADASVTLGVKTADCTPILLEARCGERVVAVAALHAGWRGTVADIVGVGVEALRTTAKACANGEATVLYAAIGPCIHACCFEVQADCISVVREMLGDFAEPYIAKIPSGYTLDLPALNRALLMRAGVAAENIDVCPDCTACRTDLYYSHRAQKGVRGTLLHVIALP